MVDDLLPYFVVFSTTLVVTLLVTPVVREACRIFGMVDMPDARRINRVPIPRGGGLAIVLGALVPYYIFHVVTDRPLVQGVSDAQASAHAILGVAIALVGLADDKWSLQPKIKLACQVAVAFLAWWWVGLGFRGLWPALPAWCDALITICWIVGAINAFNLIDGLDGLATGLAFIATIGMAGALFFGRNPQATLFHIAFAGALLGFLRYNYNPASVFLGDCGSMFIGFVIGTLPLATQTPDSFLVSVGVPMLAMGVPIFDTSLAILRRLLRRLLAGFGKKEGQSREVMTADSDHLHHRILRATGLNQRKAAWILYSAAVAAVLVGLAAMTLQSRAAGLWLAAFAVGVFVIFKDSTIELFDAGQLLNSVARAKDSRSRRRFAVLSVPFYVFIDVASLIAVFFVCYWATRREIDIHVIRVELPLRVVSTFMALVVVRTYRTIWSRAMPSNYMRMMIACLVGSVAGSVFVYYWPSASTQHLKVMTLAYAISSFVALLAVRSVRGLLRDVFYAIDCSRLRHRKGVSRILVYGSGLRYRAFRRELVRTTAANDRMIVGLIDDDVLLRGRYIGGIRVMGTINEARRIIDETNADAVVIACDFSEEWLRVVREILEPTGVSVSRFSFSETEVCGPSTSSKRKDKQQ